MPRPDGPQFRMPQGGTTAGDPSLPLYRYIRLHHEDEDFADKVDSALVQKKGRSIAGEILDRSTQRRLGSHWTHDYNQVKDWAEYHGSTGNMRGVILEAAHPGQEHTMDWDNPRDLRTMEDIIVSKDSKNMAIPEVPIRPGTPMDIKAIHVSGPDPKDKYAQDILHRIPVKRTHRA